jgi:hypothetical protein
MGLLKLIVNLYFSLAGVNAKVCLATGNPLNGDTSFGEQRIPSGVDSLAALADSLNQNQPAGGENWLISIGLISLGILSVYLLFAIRKG